MAAVLITLAVVAPALGAALLVWGWRGRRLDDHPVCRRCRFDLLGIPSLADGAKCPECGADVSGPRAVRRGNRKRRRWAVGTGVFLLLVSVGALGVVAWAAATKYDWNRAKPVWLLVREADGGDPQQCATALTELLRRERAQKLSVEARDTVVARALAAQADADRPWEPLWGDFIEHLYFGGQLSAQPIDTYARQAVKVEMRARKRVRAGEPIPVLLQLSWRTATASTLVCTARKESVRVGGNALPTDGRGPGGLTSVGVTLGMRIGALPLGSSQSRSSFLLFGGRSPGELDQHASIRAPSEAGGLEVETTWKVCVGPRSSSGRGIDIQSPLAEWTQTLRETVDIVPAESAVVELVHDESVRQAVESAVRSARLTLTPTEFTFERRGEVLMGVEAPPGLCNVQGYITLEEPSLPLAFDVHLRIGDAETPSIGWGTSETYFDFSPLVATFRGQVQDPHVVTADLVLRPNVRAAEGTVGITKIWDGEVVIHDVRLEFNDEDNVGGGNMRGDSAEQSPGPWGWLGRILGGSSKSER